MNNTRMQAASETWDQFYAANSNPADTRYLYIEKFIRMADVDYGA